MSRFITGNCVDIMAGFPDRAVDFILTDPRIWSVSVTVPAEVLLATKPTNGCNLPAMRCTAYSKRCADDRFYGWNRVDRFMAAWKNAGFSVVGHLVFPKTYTSKAAYVGYRHECAYIRRKAVRPCRKTR